MPRKSSKAQRKRVAPQNDSRGQFYLFPKLPEHIRLNIWRHASFVPRVVDVFESHDIIEIDEDSEDGEDSQDSGESDDTDNSSSSSDSSDIEDDEDEDEDKRGATGKGNDEEIEDEEAYKAAGLECATVMFSNTRPPAVLSVCREARAHGLTIYEAIDVGIRTKHPRFSQYDIPIYANPEVDIIYRSKTACEKGDAFRVRCKIWAMHSEPAAFTPTLAVDLTALSKPRNLIKRDFLFLYDQLKPNEQRGDRLKKMFKLASTPELQRLILTQELARCVDGGLRNLMIVVGNDDEMSEITLVPVERNAVQDPRVKGAFHEADRLRTDLEKYCEERSNEDDMGVKTMALPSIQVCFCLSPSVENLANEVQGNDCQTGPFKVFQPLSEIAS